jgi:hypothetical protein
MSTWAFTIDTVTEDALEEAIGAARLYVTQIPPPIRRTIGLIHGLGRLHQRASLHQLDIYLGRSGDTPKSLLNRWKAHRENPERRHKYGAVLFRSEPRRAAKLEGVANRTLLKLKKENKLCVGIANVASSGAGGYGRDAEYSTVYMTWRVLDDEIEYEKPKLSDIRELAQAAASPEDGLHSHRLENGLMALRRLSYTERLEWYKP